MSASIWLPVQPNHPLETLVVKELAHGLGFTGTMYVSLGQGRWGINEGGLTSPEIYDRFTQDVNGTPLISYTSGSTALANALQSNKVYFNSVFTNEGFADRPKLYAPSTWTQGSSYFHLDETAYPPGTADSLLTPFIDAAEVVHSPGRMVLCMLEALGWKTVEDCLHVRPADFDGDNDTDISVYRPSGGTWFVSGGVTAPFGTSGDIPVPAHFSLRDSVDIAVFRPSNGIWFVRTSLAVAWGTAATSRCPATTTATPTRISPCSARRTPSIRPPPTWSSAKSTLDRHEPGDRPERRQRHQRCVPLRAGTATVTLVSHLPASATATANGGGFTSPPALSAAGAFVAFDSPATNLVTGQSDTNGTPDVFLFERATGAVRLVSHTPGAAASTGNGRSARAVISADGTVVAFHSAATRLVTDQNDTNGATDDVFLFEQATGAVTLVSHTSDAKTDTANGSSGFPAISADGAFVAFSSFGTNLLAAQSDANGTSDVFLLERATGGVTLVSHNGGRHQHHRQRLKLLADH